eukprot:CAMPEP_0181436268 /NCGR_PEP_ID=MMETSP1110-20121109/20762_1 /TAXON_ID=174948 /ORGANISM="Symbiodinium sp., Strain CCMP421" /LENGTH=37 /DNA_ID= /DNA_START= /DNA_END= /DNA_ORIENTATION=
MGAGAACGTAYVVWAGAEYCMVCGAEYVAGAVEYVAG